MTTRITLPPESASREELWRWIEQYTPLIEAFNEREGEAEMLARKLGLRSGMQTRIFSILYARNGQCLSNESIVAAALPERDNDMLKVVISRMRATLRPHGYYIRNVWNQGYFLQVPEREAA